MRIEQKITGAERVIAARATCLASATACGMEQKRALDAFMATGLPSRKLEKWHYTDLRVLLRDLPPMPVMSSSGLRAGLLDDADVIGLVNGVGLTEELPEFVTPLRPQFAAGDAERLPAWHADDVVAQINASHVDDGFGLTIDQDRFIEIQNNIEAGQAHVYMPITIVGQVRATIVLRELGDGVSFSTCVNALEVGAGADVSFIILRQRGMQACALNQFRARLHEGAKLTLFIVNAGARLLRQEVNVDLEGHASDFQLRAVNLLTGKGHTDITMDVRHLNESSTSAEIVRNVVMDRARGVFQGMIRVAPQAQKTDARMACNSLILSDEAEFYAKPELEIFADDVACGHGATVVEINHDHLFYLMARGIPEEEARGLLIRAFVEELAEEIEHEELQAKVKDIIDQWLVESSH